MITKIFKSCKFYEKDIIFSAVIILIAVISFGLGRLSKIRENETPLIIENPGVVLRGENADLSPKQVLDKSNSQNGTSALSAQKSFVASKNGKKYHYTWCASASSIKEENKVLFSTKEEAQAAGYEPATNCKGL